MIYPAKASIITESSPGKHAVGVEVGFTVTAGEGRAEVVRGRSYRDDGGFREFEAGEVIHTSGTFSAGEVVAFSVGETD